MPRNKMPLEVAKLKGADKQNPQRYRTIPPKSQYGIGKAPPSLTKDEVKCWDELVYYSLPGVLSGSDRHIVEVTSKLLHEFRYPPSYGFDNPKLAQLMRNLGLLGMNPVDRQRLGVQKPEKPKENDFEKFR